jgi:hypothetical protein
MEYDAILQEFMSCVDPERRQVLEIQLIRFRDDREMFISVCNAVLSSDEFTHQFIIFCLMEFRHHALHFPDPLAILNMCGIRLARLPEKPECNLLTENMGLLIYHRLKFSVGVISEFLCVLPIEVYSLFLSKCITVIKYQAVNPELIDLIKQVPVESPKNAEWLRLQALGIGKSDCVEFEGFLNDTIQFLNNDSSKELRPAFSKWIKAIFQIEPSRLDNEVIANDYIRTVISFIIDWTRTTCSENWEFVSLIMGRILNPGIDFLGRESLVDLASNVFELSIQMLQIGWYAWGFGDKYRKA